MYISCADLHKNWDSSIKTQKGCFYGLISRHPEVFCKRGVLKNFAKLTGKHLCQSLLLNKVAGLACEFCEIFKNTFFIEHLRATASVETTNIL